MNREEVKRKELTSRRKSQCESQEGTENMAEWGQGCGWGGSGDGMRSLGTREVSRAQRYWKESGTFSPDGSFIRVSNKRSALCLYLHVCTLGRSLWLQLEE